MAVLVASAVVPAIVLAGGAANDSCNNSTAIFGEGTFAFDNGNASMDGLGDASCNSFGTDQIDNDVWYCWTADCNDMVTIQTCGLTGVDTKIAVYDGCDVCPPTAIIACNDDFCGYQSRVQFNAMSGNQYKIRLGTFPGAAGGMGEFNIVCGDPCENIVCDDPNDPCLEAVCEFGVCTTQPVCPDDGDECTVEECIDGVCYVTNACDDQNPCTNDECIPNDGGPGVSKGGIECIHTPVDCDDGDPCTMDFCGIYMTGEGEGEAESDPCIHIPLCQDDQNPCTIESCIDGVCTTQPVDCDDGDPCTEDICTSIDDGDGEPVCMHYPILCKDDGDPCTIEECIDGVCTTQPVDCDDGDPCTTDFCEAVIDPVGLGKGQDPNDVNYICVNEPIECTDRNLCTDDVCVDGECVFTPLDCDDGDPCTIDTCEVQGDEQEGEPVCVHTPKICEDENSCTIDACVDGECVATPVDCDDGEECTIDSCVAGECVHEPIEGCGVPQSQPESQPASQPSPDCGAGLCGFGTFGLMPFMLLGLGLMKRRQRSVRRR